MKLHGRSYEKILKQMSEILKRTELKRKRKIIDEIENEIIVGLRHE